MAAYGGANTPSNTTAGNIVGGSTYGDLSKNDAFVIQKKMLPIAKRLLTFARFAQKETKPQKQGLEIRHRRYERFPIVDTPISEGVSPAFTTIDQTTIKHTLQQYGSYVNTTDLMLAVSTDPLVQVITERQAQQCGETLDFLAYKVFRAGTQVKRADNNGSASSARSDITSTVGNVNASTAQTSATTELFDTAIRKLEQQDAKKLREKLAASTGISTEPIRESYVGICHPDLRQDLEKVPGYVSVEKYSDASDIMEGEIGTIKGVRIITTTNAVPFKGAGNSTNVGDAVKTGSNADIYPLIIMAQDFGGCATLGGVDSLRSKIVQPRPSASDPLGQRGSIGWDTFYSCVILQDLYMYRLEVACTAY